MIHIYLPVPMPHTPFGNERDLQFLEKQGIRVCKDLEESDLVVARRLSELKDFTRQQVRSGQLNMLTRKLLIWTHEPRYDTHFVRKVRLFGVYPTVHIMNTYTGDVYLNNYTIYGKFIDRKLDFLTADHFPERSPKIAAFMIYRPESTNPSLKRNGIELDLYALRTRIGLRGSELGKVDLYGSSWPDTIRVVENSREGDWHTRKMEVLTKYRFNLSLENTNFDYYCTEKIWDSIAGGCLPIYHGKGNRIYEDFPRESFLDYAEFASPDNLFQYVDSMKEGEFRARMNRCIEVFNRIHQRNDWKVFYNRMLQNIVQKVRSILGKNPWSPASS